MRVSIEALHNDVSNVSAEVEQRFAQADQQAQQAHESSFRRTGRKSDVSRTEAAHLSEAMESWRAESVAKDEFVALRSDLEEVLSRHLASAQDEVGRQLGLPDAAVVDAQGRMVDRLDEVAGWVLAQVTEAAKNALADPTASAPLHADVRALQEQVQQLTAAVFELKPRPSPSRRTPMAAKSAVKSTTKILAARKRASPRKPAEG